VSEETTRSWTEDYARRVLDLAILDKSFDELSLNSKRKKRKNWELAPT